MMDELHAKFLPQFVALARQRVEKALGVVERREIAGVPAVLRELHALAGEAGLLGLERIVPLARETETHAKQFYATRGDDVAAALVETLGQLQRAIELVAPAKPDGGHT